MKPILSIIVPIYNGSIFVDSLLKAIRSLNFKDYEVIIINDGSTDDTYHKLLRETSEDYRYTVIDQKNQGVSVARNKGIAHAKGEWIFFLDADDSISDDYFDFLEDDITKKRINPFSMVIINGVVDDYGTHKVEWPKIAHIDSANDLNFAIGNKVMKYVWGKLYKRTFITRNKIYFEKFKIAEDFLFNIKLCLCGLSITIINSGFYYYKQNSSSVTKSYNSENLLSRLAVIKRIETLFSGMKNKERMIERMYMEFFLYQTLKHLNKTNKDDKKIIIDSIRENRRYFRVSQILFLPLSIKGRIYFCCLLMKYKFWE